MAFLEFRPTQTLYKFCSSDGFFGIIKSKRLWFSDLASANDPREIRLGYEHFVEALDLIRQENLKGQQGEFISTLSKHLDRVHTGQQVFCCCFSLVADALPMWNEYGGNYGGLAIGFRPTALLSVPCRIQKVKYLKSETIDEFRSFVLSLAAQFDTIQTQEDDLIYWVRATSGSLAAMTALKHMT